MAEPKEYRARGAVGDLELRAIKTEEARTKLGIQQLKAAEQANALVRMSAVTATMTAAIAAAKRALETLPERKAHELEGRDRAEIVDILKAEVEAVLGEIVTAVKEAGAWA